MKASRLMALYKLAEMGAYDKDVTVSSGRFAKGLGLSQQTASRRLIDLEKQGLIARSSEGRIQRVKITKQGVNSLREMHKVLKPVFEAPRKELRLSASVFSGLSEGSYYMSMEGYRKQFRAKLGFDPFPGTLNLRVVADSLADRRLLDNYPFVAIDGFADKDRTYGGARCYPVIVNETVKGAIVAPIRAHHGEDVIEVIAPENLRKRLSLKDGDVVDVRIPVEC
ncbi:MAG TPA: DUF120 domain-containing protein [Candidatus Dormibacteraeota bacterium]|nr:DUF120 domain-containing protein [Candidatus Dormibacteraeota bacterium]